MTNKFILKSNFQPTGDQPGAIKKLTAGLGRGDKKQTLLGVTGSGKTFTMANIIAKTQRPALIISHNKTLAAQLASEFQTFFPNNAVHYFVSYYDYYQPEAYIPRSDTYIEKETQINEEIDRLRHAATTSLMTRNDVIIVASVSCIYGLGNPEEYLGIKIDLAVNKKYQRKDILNQLNIMQYQRNDVELKRNTYQVKGEIISIHSSAMLDTYIRLSFFGDMLEKIEEINFLTGKTINTYPAIEIYSTTHYIAAPKKLPTIIKKIKTEMLSRVKKLKMQNKLLEAQRIEQRVNFDIEMMETTGYCNGVENYSRYFDGRAKGTPPFTLIDYFPKNYLMFIDESHMTIPQIRAMQAGDRARKQTLVDFGFRLPSALDNRPLKYEEFEPKINQVVYMSATPNEYEKQASTQIVEQLIRPTGLLDPKITIKPTKYQIDNLLDEIKKTTDKKQRVLVTTMTKRLAENLTEYLQELGIKVQYIHSDVKTFERLEILQSLRQGEYDVLVGINLLREGLDLPEVSLVAILDADKEGFLRSDTTLIQTMGRAARHKKGRVIMYADKITGSMKRAIDETTRRRKTQEQYNKKYNIKPQTIEKEIKDIMLAGTSKPKNDVDKIDIKKLPKNEIKFIIKDLEAQMEIAADNLQYEKAASLRDQIAELKKVKK